MLPMLLRKEANTNADNLVNKAKDPISKRLAEEGAKKVKQEGEAVHKRSLRKQMQRLKLY